MIINLTTDIAEVAGSGCDWSDMKNVPVEITKDSAGDVVIKSDGTLTLETGDDSTIHLGDLVNIDLEDRLVTIDGYNVATDADLKATCTHTDYMSKGDLMVKSEGIHEVLRYESLNPYYTAAPITMKTGDVVKLECKSTTVSGCVIYIADKYEEGQVVTKITTLKTTRTYEYTATNDCVFIAYYPNDSHYEKDIYTKVYTTTLIDLKLDLTGKQAKLVSGENIKTINGNDLLGSGNLVLDSGKVDDVQVDGTSVVTDKVANIDLSPYARTEDVPSLDGYATEEWVEGKGYITGYTETDPVWTSEKDNYYTKTDIDGKGYITEETDPVWTAEKSSYYTKTEIDDMIGDVETAINNIAG